jgi:hypothetical protein
MPPNFSGSHPDAHRNAPQHFEHDVLEPQPSPEQVALAIRKALLFQDACPVQAERARQITEGRRMAQREGFFPAKPRDERQEQIRAGQRAVHYDNSLRQPNDPTHASILIDATSRKKKPRNRNRNRKLFS